MPLAIQTESALCLRCAAKRLGLGGRPSRHLDVQTGKALTIADVEAALPGSTVTPFSTNEALWRIKGGDWNGVADAEKIVLDAGPATVLGTRLGSSASAMQTEFDDAYCFTEEGDPWGVCNLDALSLRFKGCDPATKDEIPRSELEQCKLDEIWWLAVLPPETE